MHPTSLAPTAKLSTPNFMHRVRSTQLVIGYVAQPDIENQDRFDRLEALILSIRDDTQSLLFWEGAIYDENGNYSSPKITFTPHIITPHIITPSPSHPVFGYPIGMSHYDAIVVGAGPAGNAAAFELGRNGARIALLEKQSLPRHKTCGGGHADGGRRRA